MLTGMYSDQNFWVNPLGLDPVDLRSGPQRGSQLARHEPLDAFPAHSFRLYSSFNLGDSTRSLGQRPLLPAGMDGVPQCKHCSQAKIWRLMTHAKTIEFIKLQDSSQMGRSSSSAVNDEWATLA